MSTIVMRTGYLAVPEYVGEGSVKSESMVQWLTHKRLSQADHYKMLTNRKLDCPVQYQACCSASKKLNEQTNDRRHRNTLKHRKSL